MLPVTALTLVRELGLAWGLAVCLGLTNLLEGFLGGPGGPRDLRVGPGLGGLG